MRQRSDGATGRRIAVVTGGGRGIGRAIGLALAADGCDLAVNYRRDATAAQRTASDATALGARAIAVRASVDDPRACEAMIATVCDELGQPSILVHNAGIASSGSSVVNTSLDELDRVVRTHAFAGFHLAKLCIPHMVENDRSDIVMISSSATDAMDAYGGPYNMAKAALEALAMTLAKELRPRGVRVNVVAPGLVATEMGDRLAKAVTGGRAPDATALDHAAPFGRVGRPSDIADAVRFLVSDAAAYITGIRIRVDGGGLGVGLAEAIRQG